MSEYESDSAAPPGPEAAINATVAGWSAPPPTQESVYGSEVEEPYEDAFGYEEEPQEGWEPSPYLGDPEAHAEAAFSQVIQAEGATIAGRADAINQDAQLHELRLDLADTVARERGLAATEENHQAILEYAAQGLDERMMVARQMGYSGEQIANAQLGLGVDALRDAAHQVDVIRRYETIEDTFMRGYPQAAEAQARNAREGR